MGGSLVCNPALLFSLRRRLGRGPIAEVALEKGRLDGPDQNRDGAGPNREPQLALTSFSCSYFSVGLTSISCLLLRSTPRLPCSPLRPERIACATNRVVAVPAAIGQTHSRSGRAVRGNLAPQIAGRSGSRSREVPCPTGKRALPSLPPCLRLGPRQNCRQASRRPVENGGPGDIGQVILEMSRSLLPTSLVTAARSKALPLCACPASPTDAPIPLHPSSNPLSPGPDFQGSAAGMLLMPRSSYREVLLPTCSFYERSQRGAFLRGV